MILRHISVYTELYNATIIFFTVFPFQGGSKNYPFFKKGSSQIFYEIWSTEDCLLSPLNERCNMVKQYSISRILWPAS